MIFYKENVPEIIIPSYLDEVILIKFLGHSGYIKGSDRIILKLYTPTCLARIQFRALDSFRINFIMMPY